MPVKAPVTTPVPAAAYNWSGFYIGANVGYAWGRVRATDTPASNGVCWETCGTKWGPDVNGFTGGGQAGWNVQLQSWVVGIEGDIGYLSLKGSAADPINDDRLFVESRGGWFATLRGRAGVLFTPTVLVYATGGAIYANTRTHVFRAPDFNTDKSDGWGWTAGGGAEVRFDSAWSWKLEYLYYDLGNDRVSGPIGGGSITQYFAVKQTGHLVRVGLNYRIGAASPVIARY